MPYASLRCAYCDLKGRAPLKTNTMRVRLTRERDGCVPRRNERVLYVFFTSAWKVRLFNADHEDSFTLYIKNRGPHPFLVYSIQFYGQGNKQYLLSPTP